MSQIPVHFLSPLSCSWYRFCLNCKALQDLVEAFRPRKLPHGELDIPEIERKRIVRFAFLFPQDADSEILERVVLIERNRFLIGNGVWVRKGEAQRTRCKELGVADLVLVLSMNVAVEHGHVFVRGEQI